MREHPEGLVYHYSCSYNLFCMTKEIEVIVGPMNSGKTTELIRILNREKIA